MPTWLDNAVFYEVYPQSFQDSNADGMGDFNGITQRLGYIKDLGCTAVWLNPCFVSPFFDAGYDVADYYTAAPRYGTNEELYQLFGEAHRLGLKVILDLVPGHTSYQHPWFRESMKAEENPYTHRYVWTDSAWGMPEPGLQCLRGISQRNGAAVVNFFSTQPALNYGYFKPERSWQQPVDAPGPLATKDELKKIMAFWLNHGCDGFRVDMAGSLVKNDDDESHGCVALWQEFRAFLDEQYPEAALVSEWGEPDKSLRGGFHMDFLLHFGPSHYNDLFRGDAPCFSSRGEGDLTAFAAKYMESWIKSQRKGLICIPSGNHDMDRMARYLTPAEMKLAFAFLLSMPGAPFLYYGDEIGMRYVEGLTSVEGGFHRTGSRSPMQWDHSCNAGFSTADAGQLYIPQDPAEDRPTVADQLQNPDSLLNEVRKLIAVRRENPALQSTAGIEFLSTARPLAWLRTARDQRLLVVLNPKSQQAVLSFDGRVERVVYQNGTVALSEGRITLEAGSAVFLQV